MCTLLIKSLTYALIGSNYKTLFFFIFYFFIVGHLLDYGTYEIEGLGGFSQDGL